MAGNLIVHKTARRDFEIVEEFEAGMELQGGEVKALRKGHGVLTGAHVIARGGEVFVVGMQIPPYQPSNSDPSYDPLRTRKLLLTKQEIETLAGLESRRGFTVIPLHVFVKGRKIKMKIAAARGKKKFDKREDLKKRDDKRAMARAMKGNEK